MSPVGVERGTVTIVIADDHAVVRGGLRLLLKSEGFSVLADAGTADDAIEAVAQHQPTVLVLDLHMPGGGSLPAIPALRRAAPDTAILVLTMQDDPGYAREAMLRGARGYVLKEAEEAELIQAVRTVAAGGTYLDPELGARLLTDAGAGSPANPLTQREREVLRLLALGHTNAEVGSHLHISVRTVETHRANLQAKLGTTHRAQLVQAARERGLVGD